MTTVHQGTYLTVQHHLASACVRVIRSERAFEAVSDAVAALAECRSALKRFDPSRYGILLDWRLAPISTDPNLHKVLVGQLDALAAPFARRAILVATTVGVMQANRVSRNLSDTTLHIFNDESVALNYLTSR